MSLKINLSQSLRILRVRDEYDRPPSPYLHLVEDTMSKSASPEEHDLTILDLLASSTRQYCKQQSEERYDFLDDGI